MTQGPAPVVGSDPLGLGFRLSRGLKQVQGTDPCSCTTRAHLLARKCTQKCLACLVQSPAPEVFSPSILSILATFAAERTQASDCVPFASRTLFGCLRKQHMLLLESWNETSHLFCKVFNAQLNDPGPPPPKLTLSLCGASPRRGLPCPEDAWGWPMASGLFLVSDTGRKMLFSLKMYVYLTRFLFALQSGFHSVSYHSN